MRTLSVVLEHGNDLVHNFLLCMAFLLAVADLLRVTTTLGDEVVDVQHLDCTLLSVPLSGLVQSALTITGGFLVQSGLSVYLCGALDWIDSEAWASPLRRCD